MPRILNNNKKLLTKGQQAVLDFIIDFEASHDSAPTQEEIAANFGYTRQNAQKYLAALEGKGKIKRRGRMYRNIQLKTSA